MSAQIPDQPTRGEGSFGPAVTDLQLDVLRALWRAGEATVVEVRRALRGRRRLAPTTVGTLLRRLEKRGLVAHRKEGRCLVYRALIDEDSIARSTIDQALKGVFEGDLTAFAAHLLRRDELDANALVRIRRMIEDREAELGAEEKPNSRPPRA